jgi:hypothetical protein
MSYLRGEYYVFESEEGMQFYCGQHGNLLLPIRVFDALVMMRHAEMTEPERQQAGKDALETGGGNFGACALAKQMGRTELSDPATMTEETIREMKETVELRDPAKEMIEVLEEWEPGLYRVTYRDIQTVKEEGAKDAAE